MQAGNRAEPLYDLSFVPGWAIALIIIAFFTVLAVALYYLICLITALRGWQSYAARHKGPQETPAGIQTTSGQSMMIGGNVAPANYRHTITAGFGDAGIYIRMGAFFRAFHPPLLVPWGAVQQVSQKPAIKGVYTAVECEHLSRLVFFKSFGDSLFAHWKAMTDAGQGS